MYDFWLKKLFWFYDWPTNNIFHSLNAEIGQEDGEENGEKVGDVLEWSEDICHVIGLQYALDHSERHLNKALTELCLFFNCSDVQLQGDWLAG